MREWWWLLVFVGLFGGEMYIRRQQGRRNRERSPV
jgi:hypothetical protein